MEEEKKAIERAKEILKEWQEIVDLEDIVEREIEMTLYAEDMPFNELKILVNLVEQLEKENKELKADNSHQWEERCKLTFQFEQLEKENEELDKAVGKMFREAQDTVPKSAIRDFFRERLLKYQEADDGRYDKPYLTRGELELVDRYGECKEIAEILLAEKIELPKECISKDRIRDKIEELEKNENCTYCNNTCNKYLACKCLKEILGE